MFDYAYATTRHESQYATIGSRDSSCGVYRTPREVQDDSTRTVEWNVWVADTRALARCLPSPLVLEPHGVVESWWKGSYTISYQASVHSAAVNSNEMAQNSTLPTYPMAAWRSSSYTTRLLRFPSLESGPADLQHLSLHSLTVSTVLTCGQPLIINEISRDGLEGRVKPPLMDGFSQLVSSRACLDTIALYGPPLCCTVGSKMREKSLPEGRNPPPKHAVRAGGAQVP